MAAGLQAPSKSSLDDWSVREKLVLACCVIRSGDQNWASVSRTIKPICEAVENRTSDWFSQKNCANQYSDLLEGTSTKKRKRTSSESGANETPMEQIIRKLSFERIDELKKYIQADRKKYKKLKNDIEKIRSGKIDDQLQHIWNDLHSDRKMLIEHIIPEEMLELPISMDSLGPGFATNSPHLQQQQQQSSALYHRSKSQRQPKATKKFETWMTQLKQQQARHQQSHAGSTHTSPHGQSTATSAAAVDGLSLSGGDLSSNPALRQQQQQSAQQSSFHQLQQQHLYLQQQQQNQFQQQQQLLQKQQQIPQNPMIPQTSPLRQISALDCQPAAQAAFAESSSVLSSLLSAPTSEIKAAAALQKKIIEKTVAAEDATGLALPNKEETLSVEDESASTASISATAPTLSKLLGSSCDTSPTGVYTGRRMSTSSDEGEPAKDVKIEQSRFSFKDDMDTALLKSAPADKANKALPEISPQKKNILDGSHQAAIEPLHIKVEDEDYLPENESAATPDSSQTSPRARGRKPKGRRGLKKKQLQHLLIKNLEALQDSEDTGSVDEQASERDETESEVASVSDAKDTSDGEQEESQLGDEIEDQKMADDSPEVREKIAMRKQRGRLPSSTSSSTMVLSPSSPTLSTGSNDPDNAQAQRNWRKSIMLVWKSIASHKYANVFMHPVTNDEAPGYHNIIKKPIDLSTIKKNIETGVLKTTSEFQRDTMLMFQNALMYNRADHDVYRMAEEMREEVMEQIQSFIATQFHLLVQSSDRDTMMLRGHRSEGEWLETRKSKSHGRGSGKI